ncbi:hypothetical protein TorRG33x02_058940 [Trema orientale]|uniref:Uncharacterized protein n=1 Tax=Trema orientale TaxID=63057 RepID=A0A2P5FKK6_TREOI|nr:hypothetical protein TorRG33x02_058940 [Trema orientale]
MERKRLTNMDPQTTSHRTILTSHNREKAGHLAGVLKTDGKGEQLAKLSRLESSMSTIPATELELELAPTGRGRHCDRASAQLRLSYRMTETELEHAKTEQELELGHSAREDDDDATLPERGQ